MLIEQQLNGPATATKAIKSLMSDLAGMEMSTRLFLFEFESEIQAQTFSLACHDSERLVNGQCPLQLLL